MPVLITCNDKDPVVPSAVCVMAADVCAAPTVVLAEGSSHTLVRMSDGKKQSPPSVRVREFLIARAVEKSTPPPAAPEPSPLRVSTWNIAAVNNNPFEYWLTHPDADYEKLMTDVQNFVENPGDDE